MKPPSAQPPKEAPFAPVLERNIAALIERRRALEQQSSTGQRVAAAVSRFAGSMPFVYVHLAIVGVWIAINRGWTALPPFDPTFVILATAASVEAIFLSTFVLIAQNRLAAEAERQAELDLHISLLAEHEITRMLKLVTAMAGKLGVDEPDPELDRLKEDVAPEQLLDRIDAAHGAADHGATS